MLFARLFLGLARSPGDDDGGGGNNSNNNNDDDDNDKYKRHASALWRAPRDARLSQGDSAVGFTMAMQFAPWTTSRRPKHLRHAWRPPTSSGRSTRYSGPGTACTAYIQAAGGMPPCHWGSERVARQKIHYIRTHAASRAGKSSLLPRRKQKLWQRALAPVTIVSR